MCPLRATLRERILAPSGSSPFPPVSNSAEEFMIAFSSLLAGLLGSDQYFVRPATRETIACPPPCDASPKTSGDILLGFLLVGMRKQCCCLSLFDNASQEEKDGSICHTPGLLHVMCHNDDSIGLLKLTDQLLNLQCRDGIKGRGGFIHQQDFRLVRECPCNAESLLLPTRELCGR